MSHRVLADVSGSCKDGVCSIGTCSCSTLRTCAEKRFLLSSGSARVCKNAIPSHLVQTVSMELPFSEGAVSDSDGEVPNLAPAVQPVPQCIIFNGASGSGSSDTASFDAGSGGPRKSLRKIFAHPEDASCWHPTRLFLDLLEYLLQQFPHRGVKRRRFSQKQYPSVLPCIIDSMQNFEAAEQLSYTKSELLGGRDQYRRIGMFLSNTSRRQFIGTHCQWDKTTTSVAVRRSWALLVRHCGTYRSLWKAVRGATDAKALENAVPASGAASASSTSDSTPDIQIKGFGFLLTFNLNVGENNDQARAIVIRGLPSKAKCQEFSQVECYRQTFEDAVSWATKLSADLHLPLVNVGMELSENSPDAWRVHVHILVAIDPRRLSGIGKLFAQEVGLRQFQWNNVKPNVSACNPPRPTEKVVLSHLSNLSYYVMGPKIGQILSRGNIVPIKDCGLNKKL